MNTVRAVLFDAANTLFYNRRLEDRMVELDEGGDDRLRSEPLRRSIAIVSGRGLWPEDSATRQERLDRWTEFYGLALTEAGLSAAQARPLADELAEIVVDPSSYALFDDVEPVLAAIASLDLPSGIVSNFDGLLWPILDHIGLTGRFPVVVTSWEVGAYKPDPRIFEHALRQLRIGPENVIFVGDSPVADVGGAQAIGMTPVLIDRTGTSPDCAAHTIASLGHLMSLIGSR